MSSNCGPLSRPGDPDDWSLLSEKIDRLRIPFSGGIALTHRCNLRCVHCYAQDDRPAGRELSAERWKGIIEEIKDAGCLFLLLTGGEPLLREDFGEIYAHLKNNGFLVTLFTNGTLLTEGTADLLKEFPPRSVEISLYGATPETHDRITGVAGSFDRALRAVDELMRREIRIALKSVLMTLNVHESRALEELARALNVDYRVDASIFPGLNGDRTPLAYRVTPEQAVAAEFVDPKRAVDWREFLDRFRSAPEPEELYACSAGLTTFHIDPQGLLYPCLMVRKIAYPLATGSFRQGWEEVLPRLREVTLDPHSKCFGCRHRLVCEYCPGFFELESGDDRIPPEFLCALGRLRFDRLNAI
jgi:radical SAM protein with 4Fe4S-binding SPASM domain